MMSRTLVVLLALTACDREGRDYIAWPEDSHPGVQNLDERVGELPVMTAAQFDNFETRHAMSVYAELGAPLPGTFGGATITFTAPGTDVCILVDPEAVFWNQAVAATLPDENYSYPDNYRDDGDIDMEIGLTAYYTGSPGVEMGDFAAVYEDSLGNETRLEFNECYMPGYGSTTNAHAGRASIEYCDLDTSLHPNKSYTVVLNTYSIPLDDNRLGFVVAAVEGACSDIGVSGGGLTECLFQGEAGSFHDADDKAYEDGLFHTRADLVGNEAVDVPGAEGWSGTQLEQEFCLGDLNVFCQNHPHLCGEI